MSKYSSEELNAVYHALANTARRRMLTRLAKEGKLSVSDLAEPFDMSLAAVSKHIKVLEKAGLVEKNREGTTFFCTLNHDPLKNAAALIHYFESFWQTGSGSVVTREAA